MNERTALARAVAPFMSTWKHKKGGTYTVVGHALHTETGTAMIVYKRIAGPDFDSEGERDVHYARPVELWTPDRFERIDFLAS